MSGTTVEKNYSLGAAVQIFLEEHNNIIVYDPLEAVPKYYQVKKWKLNSVENTRYIGPTKLGVIFNTVRVYPKGAQYIISTLLEDMGEKAPNDFSKQSALKVGGFHLDLMSMNVSSNMESYVFKFQASKESQEY